MTGNSRSVLSEPRFFYPHPFFTLDISVYDIIDIFVMRCNVHLPDYMLAIRHETRFSINLWSLFSQQSVGSKNSSHIQQKAVPLIVLKVTLIITFPKNSLQVHTSSSIPLNMKMVLTSCYSIGIMKLQWGSDDWKNIKVEVPVRSEPLMAPHNTIT